MYLYATSHSVTLTGRLQLAMARLEELMQVTMAEMVAMAMVVARGRAAKVSQGSRL